MDALASAYSDDDGSGSDRVEENSPHLPRTENPDGAGAAKRPRLALPEVPHLTLAEMHAKSLVRLQRECPLLPSASAAAVRRAQWEWFRNICDTEFADEIGPGTGLQLFGSWSYDMWVTTSDFDANMFSLSRIPNFFPRLKRAVVAAHPSAEVRENLLITRPA